MTLSKIHSFEPLWHGEQCFGNYQIRENTVKYAAPL